MRSPAEFGAFTTKSEATDMSLPLLGVSDQNSLFDGHELAHLFHALAIIFLRINRHTHQLLILKTFIAIVLNFNILIINQA